MTPLEKYRQDIEQEGFRRDPAQENAVLETQALYDRLVQPVAAGESGLLGRWFRKSRPEPVTGLYFWGGVGRGKTYLIDSLYHCLPLNEKRRVHFQRFMQDIHQALQHLPKSPDPLQVIGDQLAREVRVLVVDEFHVDDITDAMILAGFLKALFERGITLVTTSNIPVEDLYKNGLQRSRFLPAIDLLKQYTQSVHIDGGRDYRRALLEEYGTYHVMDKAGSQAFVDQHFQRLAFGRVRRGGWSLMNREIDVEAISEDAIWFNFTELCDTPRSAADYQMLAQSFATIFLHHVPVMTAANDDVAQRFIQLIDALYDHGVKLTLTADAEPEGLYRGEQLAFPFQRTISRLHEMRSRQYLGRAHDGIATTENDDGGNGR